MLPLLSRCGLAAAARARAAAAALPLLSSTPADRRCSPADAARLGAPALRRFGNSSYVETEARSAAKAGVSFFCFCLLPPFFHLPAFPHCLVSRIAPWLSQ
jgi:hypothetical protein